MRLADPGLGRRFIPHEQFRKAFTGVALLFEPSETFETGKATRGTHRYMRLVLEARALLGRVLVTSLLLQVLALALPALTGAVVDVVLPTGDVPLLGVLSAGMAVLLIFQNPLLAGAGPPADAPAHPHGRAAYPGLRGSPDPPAFSFFHACAPREI